MIEPPSRLVTAKPCQTTGLRTARLAEPKAQQGRSEEEEEEVDPALLPADAPPDHIAHARCRFNGTHQNPLVSFRFDGIPFQTTVGATRSRRAAEVIARACWLRFEKGWSKDEVLNFRNECYDHLKSRSPAKRPRIEIGKVCVPETPPATHLLESPLTSS